MTSYKKQQEQENQLYGKLVIKGIYYFIKKEDNSCIKTNMKIVGHIIEISRKYDFPGEHHYLPLDTLVVIPKLNPRFENASSIGLKIDARPELKIDVSGAVYQQIETYFSGVNAPILKKQEEKLEQYKKSSNEVLKVLFDQKDKLTDAIRNFIKSQSRSQFTDFVKIMVLHEYLLRLDQEKYGKLMLVSEETVQAFAREYANEFASYSKSFSFFIEDDFKYYLKLLQEYDKGADIFSAYMFLMENVVQYYAGKWEEDYGNKFAEINTMSLEDALGIFSSLDEIDSSDKEGQGCFFYYLFKKGKFDGDRKLFDHVVHYQSLLRENIENNKFKHFKNRLMTTADKFMYSINDVDLMDGLEFEEFISLLLSKIGYKTVVTKASGDQGIDVIAEKKGIKIGVQAKCYSGTVGNSAVQEAVSGKAFYRLDKAVVVTNNFFTDSAIQLAQANGVILWDRNLLKEKISEAFST